jgi:hypothetical protein
MTAQGTSGFSYRLLYDPERDRCLPVPATASRDVLPKL